MRKSYLVIGLSLFELISKALPIMNQGALEATGCSGSWIYPQNGHWDVGSHWSSGCIPGAAPGTYDTATLANITGASSIVIILGSPITLNKILYGNSLGSTTTDYGVFGFGSGTNTIALDTGIGGPNPEVIVYGGSHQLQPTTLTLNPSMHSTEVNFYLGGDLENGFDTISGSGTLILNELSSQSGTFTNHASIVIPNLTIRGGSLNNHGFITLTDTFTLQGVPGNSTAVNLTNHEEVSANTIIFDGTHGATVTNNHTITGGTIDITSTNLTNASFATLSASDSLTIHSGTISNLGTITQTGNNGTIIFSGGTVNNTDAGMITATGTGSSIEVSGATVNFNGDGSIYTTGTGSSIVISGGALNVNTGAAGQQGVTEFIHTAGTFTLTGDGLGGTSYTQTPGPGSGPGLGPVLLDYSPMSLTGSFTVGGPGSPSGLCSATVFNASANSIVVGGGASTTTMTCNNLNSATTISMGGGTGNTTVVTYEFGGYSCPGAWTVGSVSGTGDTSLTIKSNNTVTSGPFSLVSSLMSGESSLITGNLITASSFSMGPNSALTLDFAGGLLTPYGNIVATAPMSSTATIVLDGTLNITSSGGFTPAPGSTIVLLQATSPGFVSGQFSIPNVPAQFGSLTIDRSEVYLYVDPSGCSGSWQSSMSGNWDNGGDWSSGCPPGTISGTYDYALFGNVMGATNTTVTLANSGGTLPQAVNLHKIEFGNPTGATTTDYTLSQFNPMSTITLDSPTGGKNPKIHVFGGDHTIDAPIILTPSEHVTETDFFIAGSLTLGLNSSISSTSLAASLEIYPESTNLQGGTLVNQNSISASSMGITDAAMTNSGTMTIQGGLRITGTNANASLSTSGTVTVEALDVSATSGTSTLTNTGALTSSGLIELQKGTLLSNQTVTADTFSMDANSTLTLQFGAMASPYGKIIATQTNPVATINLGGTLDVTTGGYAPPPQSTVTLLQALGAGKVKGIFSTANIPSGFGSVTYDSNEVYLVVAGVCSGSWISASSGYWDTTGNWSDLCAPGITNMASVHDYAIFDNVMGASSTTITLANAGGTLPQDVTLHKVEFGSSTVSTTTNYTIDPFTTSTLTLDSAPGGKAPKIVVYGGSHTLDLPILISPSGNVPSASFLVGGTLNLSSMATISGPGSLTILEGANNAGTLINDGTIQPPAMTINGSSVTNSGTINLSGPLTIQALGSNFAATSFLNLTGGTTTADSLIADGSDQAVSITNGGALTANSSMDFTEAVIANTGTMMGGGGAFITIHSGVVANNAGGVFASGVGGAITIAGGTVANAAGGTFGSADCNLVHTNGSLTNAGLLNGNNHSQESSMAGTVLTNSGTMSIVGDFEIGGAGSTVGTAALTNSSSISAGNVSIGGGTAATTVVNSGSFLANGSFTLSGGTVQNQAAATMAAGTGGAFTIGGGTLTNSQGASLGSSSADFVFTGGSLSNSGTLDAKNYTQGAAAGLHLNVTSITTFGRIAANETASLNGSLTVNAATGFSMTDGQSVVLIDPASVQGTFSNVSFLNFPTNLIPNIAYLPNAVELVIRGTNPTPSHGSAQSVVFNSISQHNSFLTLQMMHMRDRMSQPAAPLAAKFLPYSVDELLAENEEIKVASREKPAIIAQQPGVIQKTAQLSQRAAKDHFPWSIYAGPVASFGHVKDKGAQLGLGYASAGGLAGFDKVAEDEETRSYRFGYGAIVEYRNIWSTINNGGGSGSTDRIHGSLYATAIPKAIPNLAIEGVAGFAFNWDHLERKTGIDLASTAVGSTTETIGDLLLGFEYTLSGNERTWLPCSFTVIPLMTWQYVVDHVAGYSESGAGIYDLRYEAYNPMSLTSLLGSRFQYLFRGVNADLRLEIDAGWQHEYLNRSFIVTATAFTITTGSVSSRTAAPGRNSLVAAIDLLAIYNGGWTIEFNNTYQLNNLYYDVFFYLGFGREF